MTLKEAKQAQRLYILEEVRKGCTNGPELLVKLKKRFKSAPTIIGR